MQKKKPQRTKDDEEQFDSIRYSTRATGQPVRAGRRRHFCFPEPRGRRLWSMKPWAEGKIPGIGLGSASQLEPAHMPTWVRHSSSTAVERMKTYIEEGLRVRVGADN